MESILSSGCFHASWLRVLIESSRNSTVNDLFGVLYGKALMNNHLLFVHVKLILSESHF